MSPTSCFHIDDSPSLAWAIVWGKAEAQTQVLEDAEADTEEAVLSLQPPAVA